jgi:hypothetical protein
LAGITSGEFSNGESGEDHFRSHNGYLAATYLPEHNAPFAVASGEEDSAIVPFAASLRDILCIKHDRVVSRDNCVRYEGRVLQIPEQEVLIPDEVGH